MGKALTTRKSDLRDISKFPKNNYFCYRWRVVDHFNKTIERDLFQMHLSGGAYHQSLQNERIMALYKMTYRRRKNDFISQLTRDAMTFLDTRRAEVSKAVREESAYTKAMTTIVDSLFNILLSCSIELNTVLGFSELFVAATEPEVQTYMVSGRTRIKSMYARFSTSLYSLILYGNKNKISLFVVPVEGLIGNSTPGDGHEAVAECIGRLEGENVVWTYRGQDLTEDALETMCHDALRQLISETKLILAQSPPQII